MKKKYLAISLCVIITLGMPGCAMRRNMPPGQTAGQGNKGSMISASYGMADLYNVTLKSNSTVKSGTDGTATNLGNLSSGTTVRALGKVDNNWYVVMPNNSQVGLIPIGSASPTPTTPQKSIPSVPNAPSSGSTTEESTMVNLVNGARASNGLKALSADDQITKIARVKAQDIAKNNYFSHVSPTYGSPFDMMKSFGVSYLYAGENLAKNSNVGAAETAVMNSPGHKANILNSNFTNIGIGIATANDGTKIYVQMFVGR